MISPFDDTNLRTARTKDVFPDPDSPTMPSVYINLRLKFNESTALT